VNTGNLVHRPFLVPDVSMVSRLASEVNRLLLMSVSGANNGQLASIQDFVAGALINYTYDSLKRLATASTARQSNNWTENYTYDGFGNLTQMRVRIRQET
jgi:YD repeat-containing protein